MNILVIHGPNLGLLGTREPDVYGSQTLGDINAMLEKRIEKTAHSLDIQQFDSEGEIVSAIGNSTADAIVINPAAYTHTSVAIADALRAVGKPAIEVHLSNIYQREEYRHKSLIASAVVGQISGLGARSYLLALDYFLQEGE